MQTLATDLQSSFTGKVLPILALKASNTPTVAQQLSATLLSFPSPSEIARNNPESEKIVYSVFSNFEIAFAAALNKYYEEDKLNDLIIYANNVKNNPKIISQDPIATDSKEFNNLKVKARLLSDVAQNCIRTLILDCRGQSTSDSVANILAKFTEAIPTKEEAKRLLDNFRVTFEFTSHPTDACSLEARELQYNVARAFFTLSDDSLIKAVEKLCLLSTKQIVRPLVTVEYEGEIYRNGMDRAWEQIGYSALSTSALIDNTYLNEPNRVASLLPTQPHFGGWTGKDGDGNPLIDETARKLESVRNRAFAAEKYINSLDEILFAFNVPPPAIVSLCDKIKLKLSDIRAIGLLADAVSENLDIPLVVKTTNGKQTAYSVSFPNTEPIFISSQLANKWKTLEGDDNHSSIKEIYYQINRYTDKDLIQDIKDLDTRLITFYQKNDNLYSFAVKLVARAESIGLFDEKGQTRCSESKVSKAFTEVFSGIDKLITDPYLTTGQGGGSTAFEILSPTDQEYILFNKLLKLSNEELFRLVVPDTSLTGRELENAVVAKVKTLLEAKNYTADGVYLGERNQGLNIIYTSFFDGVSVIFSDSSDITVLLKAYTLSKVLKLVADREAGETGLTRDHFRFIPLCESSKDISNADKIFQAMTKLPVEAYQRFATIMFGPSDSGKRAGSTAASIDIFSAVEEIHHTIETLYPSRKDIVNIELGSGTSFARQVPLEVLSLIANIWPHFIQTSQGQIGRDLMSLIRRGESTQAMILLSHLEPESRANIIKDLERTNKYKVSEILRKNYERFTVGEFKSGFTLFMEKVAPESVNKLIASYLASRPTKRSDAGDATKTATSGDDSILENVRAISYVRQCILTGSYLVSLAGVGQTLKELQDNFGTDKLQELYNESTLFKSLIDKVRVDLRHYDSDLLDEYIELATLSDQEREQVNVFISALKSDIKITSKIFDSIIPEKYSNDANSLCLVYENHQGWVFEHSLYQILNLHKQFSQLVNPSAVEIEEFRVEICANLLCVLDATGQGN
jgi:hypothetical protein